MAATAKNYSALTTVSGPVDIWLECGVPGAGAAPTLASDGTPDDATSPNAVHAGMLKTGGGFNVNAELQERTSDNLSAPYEVRVLTATMAITGDMLQFDAELLGLITPSATVDGSPPTGKTGVTIGDVTAVNSSCVYGIWERKTAGKYYNVVIYDAYQANGFELALNRNEDGAAEVSFQSIAVTSRAAVDRTGAIWLDDLS
jgi:hypothetical protein